MNLFDAPGFKDKDFTTGRIPEVVGDFVHENEVAGVDPALGKNLPLFDSVNSRLVAIGGRDLRRHEETGPVLLVISPWDVEVEVFAEVESIDNGSFGAAHGDFL